jgi:RecA/RadA recombinase
MNKPGASENEKMRITPRLDGWDGDMFTFKELKDCSFPEADWLVFQHMPKGSITGLVGKPGDGKSMLVRMLIASVLLRKTDFLGLPLITKNGKVIFFTAEDTDARTKSYFIHQLKALSPSVFSSDLEENLTILFKGDHTPDEIEEKIRFLAAFEIPDLIVIDNFSAIFPGTDPNNTALVRKALEPYVQIARLFNCAIVIIHHLRKAGYALRPDQEHAQGASGFGQIVRSMLDLRRDPFDTQTRYLTLIKGNYSTDEHLYRSRVLKFESGSLLFLFTSRIILAEDTPIRDDSSSFGSLPWVDIFDEKKELTRKELVVILGEECGISRASVDRHLKRLTRNGQGKYSLPENFSISHSQKSPSETNPNKKE